MSTPIARVLPVRLGIAALLCAVPPLLAGCGAEDDPAIVDGIDARTDADDTTGDLGHVPDTTADTPRPDIEDTTVPLDTEDDARAETGPDAPDGDVVPLPDSTEDAEGDSAQDVGEDTDPDVGSDASADPIGDTPGEDTPSDVSHDVVEDAADDTEEVVPDDTTPPDPCELVDCVENHTCVDGVCIPDVPPDPCEDIVCDEDQTCVEGVCVDDVPPDPCELIDCEEDQTCVDGACIDDVPPDPDAVVSFCRLQFPTEIPAVAGSIATAYGRVYAAGITDRTTGTDPYARLLAQFGWGTPVETPADWNWEDAEPNTGFDGAAFGEPNNDEYQYPWTLPDPLPIGETLFAWRFSGDGGATWVYCDAGDPGSTDGFTQPGRLADPE